MAASIAFPSVTSTHLLPLLFSGQAQKEVSLNHALTLIDGLLQRCVDGTLPTPPAAVEEGMVFRVAQNATGNWFNKDDQLAIFIGGVWSFLPPYDGLTLFDRTEQHYVQFRSGWSSAIAPAIPTGGSTVDAEARQAISELTTQLEELGILAPTT